MKKILKYESFPLAGQICPTVAGQNVVVRITEQSNRGKEFGAHSDTFRADNNVYLISQHCPEVCAGMNVINVYVKGDAHNKDDYLLVFPDWKQFQAFEQAVALYNNTEFEDEEDIPIEIISKAQENIEKYIRKNIEEIHIKLNKTENIVEIDTLMEWKKDLMLNIIKMLPISNEHCLYCLHYNYRIGDDSCGKCSYGQKKGICHKSNSAYKNVYTRFIQITEAIKDYY